MQNSLTLTPKLISSLMAMVTPTGDALVDIPTGELLVSHGMLTWSIGSLEFMLRDIDGQLEVEISGRSEQIDSEQISNRDLDVTLLFSSNHAELAQRYFAKVLSEYLSLYKKGEWTFSTLAKLTVFNNGGYGVYLPQVHRETRNINYFIEFPNRDPRFEAWVRLPKTFNSNDYVDYKLVERVEQRLVDGKTLYLIDGHSFEITEENQSGDAVTLRDHNTGRTWQRGVATYHSTINFIRTNQGSEGNWQPLSTFGQ